MDRIATILLVALSLSSCMTGSRDLDFPESRHLYLNAVAPASATEIRVSAGLTKPIVGQGTPMESKIELTAFVNGTPTEVEPSEEGYLLRPKRGLVAGDEIALSATSAGMPSISAKCRVPAAPTLLSARGEWIPAKEGKSRVRVRLSVEPTDGMAYYRVIVRSNWYAESLGMLPGDFREQEIITFGNPLFPQPQDQLFNEARNAPFALVALQKGSELTFEYYDWKLEDPEGRFDWVYQAKVELQHLSKDYYLYLLSCLNSESNNAFENPVKIHSNVRDGFGILAIYSPAVIPIEIGK